MHGIHVQLAKYFITNEITANYNENFTDTTRLDK